MKVSVVIPVYNKAPFVKEAITSILDGTFTDFELIAVDDASTDRSPETVRSIDDDRIRIIELPHNLGPAGAMQAGIDAAQGEYIVRMDADDRSTRKRIERQVAFMDAHPEIGASGGQLELFGSETGWWSYPLAPDDCAAQLVFDSPVAQGASILRRSVLDAHGIHYEPSWPRNGEDRLFWLRMAPHTQFANLPKTILHYRRGPQNIGASRDRNADVAAIQREAFKAFGIPHTEHDLGLYLLGRFIFTIKPTAKDVKDLRAWYDRLLQLNTERSFAPKEAFRKRVEEQWERLYNYLPRYGFSPALAHLRSSGDRPFSKLWYAFRFRMNLLLGRLPKH